MTRAIAETLLGSLGYRVTVDEARVVQVGRLVVAPTAPHFLWHELGHALAYLGDMVPEHPADGWYPLPRWLARMNLPEPEADRYADAFAHHAARLVGLEGAPGGTPGVWAERAQLYRRVPEFQRLTFERRILIALKLAGL